MDAESIHPFFLGLPLGLLDGVEVALHQAVDAGNGGTDHNGVGTQVKGLMGLGWRPNPPFTDHWHRTMFDHGL